MEPELTCIESGGKSKGLGQLNGGFMITVSLGLARRYLYAFLQTKLLFILGVQPTVLFTCFSERGRCEV